MEELNFLDFEEFRKLRNFNRKKIILLDYPPKDFFDFSIDLVEKYNIEEFYPNSLLKNIEKRSWKLIEEFYKNLEDKTIYRNINLSLIIKNQLYLYFVKFIKYIDILDYIIKKNTPKKVIVKYHEIEKDHNFISNLDLYLFILKEICSVKKLSIEVNVIKKKKGLLNFKIKNTLINIMGLLQNLYFKVALSKNNNKKKILFVGGKNAYLSILKHLKGKAKILRCGITPGLSFFNSDQDHYLTFWNKPRYKKFNFDKNEFISNIKYIRYGQYSFYKMFSANLDYLFDIYFKILIRWIDIAYKIEPYVDAVVTTNDVLPLEEIIINVLKYNKKESYLIEHGYTTLSDNLFPFVKEKMLANKMFLWGNESKKWMIKQGLKKENLIVTGSPKFDGYYIKDTLDIRKEFNISFNKKIIFFAAPPKKDTEYPKYFLSNKEYTELYRIIFDAMKNLNEFFLIIKPHPDDININIQKKILEKKNVNNIIIVDKKFHLKSLLKQSDLIMSTGSTVNLETMFFKKPIIVLNFFNKAKLDSFVDNRMCLGLTNKNKLKEIILYAFKNKDRLVKNYSKYFKNYALSDGKAYKRISDIILNN